MGNAIMMKKAGGSDSGVIDLSFTATSAIQTIILPKEISAYIGWIEADDDFEQLTGSGFAIVFGLIAFNASKTLGGVTKSRNSDLFPYNSSTSAWGADSANYVSASSTKIIIGSGVAELKIGFHYTLKIMEI